MSNNEDEDKVTSSSEDDDDDDDDNESASSSSTSSSEDEPAEEDSDDDSAISEEKLTPKQAYAYLENKRKDLGKRLLELRDELKAQPQADIDVKKRLLTEIKNIREKWIAVQTRLTNLKARLSHSPTPERTKAATSVKQTVITKKEPEKKVESPKVEQRIIPPPRESNDSRRSSSSRSRSSSRESRESNAYSYKDLDAFDERDNRVTMPIKSSVPNRATTSYRDLTEDLSMSPTPSPQSQSMDDNRNTLSNLDQMSLTEPKIDGADEDDIQPMTSKETYYNQRIPYPIVNDKRDLELINRQIKNQLRQFEASRNNPLYDEQANQLMYDRLKKQNEFINIRMRIERLKKVKAKTQRDREQNKKLFHTLVQEFRKLQKFMRAANRQSTNIYPMMIFQEQPMPLSIPLPPSPKETRQEEFISTPYDLNKVTGKKTIFESDDSDDEEENRPEPQVPVVLSVSEPRTVPDQISIPPPPPPSFSSNSRLSPEFDAIKSRFANIINSTLPSSVTKVESKEKANQDYNKDDDDDDDDEDDQPVRSETKPSTIPKSARFNRKRRKNKRNRHKKKQGNRQGLQDATNENESVTIDQEEIWKRYVAMQLQYRFLQATNPVLKALTAEAQKKLGINQEDIGDIPFDGEIMDYETALILQQQEEYLAAAEANPFNILHNAAVGSSASRPTLVDILSNLNGGIPSSSSNEPQTPMRLLQKFFLDAGNHASNDPRSHNDLSTTPPTPPTPRDISIGKKIVESLTTQDISALLRLSGSGHDDDDDDDDYDDNDHDRNARGENNRSVLNDSENDGSHLSLDDDDDDDDDDDETLNGNQQMYDRWERPTPIPSRINQNSNLTNKKPTSESLILPSFNRCTHLGRPTKRASGLERMFPSFSKHNTGPLSTLSMLLYGISSNP